MVFGKCIKAYGAKGYNGYPDGTFMYKTTTTAEFLAMLLASMGYKQEAGQVSGTTTM